MVIRHKADFPLISVRRREGEPIERTVVERLRKMGQTLSVAESCTGGLLASRITSVEGCSGVFLEGFILYSNEAKLKRLCLSESTIQLYGVVSKEVVMQMAERLLHISGTHHALCTTGLAGPTGGTQQIPIGTVFIGLASQHADVKVCKEFFPRTPRESFKQLAVDAALDMLLCRLIKTTTS